jgi:hypothetical protein
LTLKENKNLLRVENEKKTVQILAKWYKKTIDTQIKYYLFVLVKLVQP